MSNNINVTVELGTETQAKLDKILEALQTLQENRPNCQSCTETALSVMGENLRNATGKPAAPASAAETVAPETGHPVDEVSPHGDPEPAAEAGQPEAPKYTKEDIQALVRKLAAPTSPERKRAGAKAIVTSYGAKVSDIPGNKYGEVMAKLIALDEEG